MTDAVPDCPRCRVQLREIQQNDTFLDRCDRCEGTFFDQGEMFTALGKTADPAYWDRPETAGPVRNGEVKCPRCHGVMLLQDVGGGDEVVEIDRCARCGGIWLDKGETDKIMAIGTRAGAAILAERQAARDELARMGDVELRPPGLITRFLALFTS